ncbi:MAG: sulfatase-like hydrolase/transferase [Bryobacteraceae bacterium]|nr:sulfatase-like hydrolase/transferase [Bryobacteraceae bacterium]
MTRRANSVYGCSEIRTPNIDKLAQSGVRFTNAFAAAPVCPPSRMTWATGLMPCSHGVQDWLILKDSTGQGSRGWLGPNLTWFEVLKRGGYRLGMTGKWHMGFDEKAQRGFSYWATVPGGGGTYRNPEFVVNGKRRRYEGFK